MKRVISLLVTATLAAAGPAKSQTAQLVADLNPGPPVPVIEGGPRQYATALGRVVFFAPQPDGQNETLWSTDGTDAGTRPLLSVGPGELPASFPQPAAVVASLTGQVFFVARTTGERFRLFRTDGSRSGTLALSVPLFSFRFARRVGEELYWSGCGDDGCGLWRSDGTLAGTRRVFAGEAISVERLANQTYFVALPPRSALYRTDGTAEGTSLVKDLPAGFGDPLTPAQGRLYFAAGDLGAELWVSDGSRRGTFRVRELFEDDCRFCTRNTAFLGTVGGALYFFADGADGFGVQLWKSDGTPAGTRRLTAFTQADRARAKAAIGEARNVIGLTSGRALLALGGTAGPRLWTTRGSVASTLPLTGCPGGCPAVLSPLFRLGRQVLFVGEHPASGTEIWATDGTGPGTRVLFDLCGGRCSSSPAALTTVGGTLFFTAEEHGVPSLFACDGAVTRHLGPMAEPSADQRLDLALLGSSIVFTGFDERYGRQPWVSDGTSFGARMIAPLGAPGAGSAPRQLTALGERVLFSATDGVERRLFASDGTAGATIPLTGGPDPEQLTVAGGNGFFAVNLPNDAGSELWTTDGTPDGTRVLATFADRALSHLMELAGRLVFLVSSTLGERPLHAFFASDGTAAGTAKLFDLPDDTVSVADVAGLGGEIYFVARGESGIRLLRSDGTPAGTRPIYELPCDCTSPGQPLSYARVGQHVFFTALAEGAFGLGTALFRSDGTAAGTVEVIPPFAGPAQRIVEPSALFSFGGDLYFFARSPELAGEARSGLFRGTGLDAVQLSSAGSEPGREALPQYTAAGDTLFFRAWDPEHGFELWKTDGTPAGTRLVEDIAPGPLSSDPRGLVTSRGRLFFAASDELHGRELWTSDGSETRLVQDLAPGPLSSVPEGMTRLGNQLFFAADDGHVGREPWRLELAPTPGGSSGLR